VFSQADLKQEEELRGSLFKIVDNVDASTNALSHHIQHVADLEDMIKEQ